jgi:hypothetical protein
MGFLHINPLMKGEVFNYWDLITSESEDLPFHQLKLVKFTFASLDEALRRAAVIAILTYTRGGGFIKLFTLPQLARGVSFGSELSKMQRFFMIDPDEYASHPFNKVMQLAQPHQGILRGYHASSRNSRCLSREKPTPQTNSGSVVARRT